MNSTFNFILESSIRRTWSSDSNSTVATTTEGWGRATPISSLTSLVSIFDEVNFWLLLTWGCWSADVDRWARLCLFAQNVNQVLMLVLFWKDYLGFEMARLGRSLYEDNVDLKNTKIRHKVRYLSQLKFIDSVDNLRACLLLAPG